MSTYVVGDLQGCLTPLLNLLEQVDFDTKKDTLWCTGDLINRGPQSLETLRFIYQLGNACITVLGNHDLHLLAVAFANMPMKKADTLQEILDAPDAHELLHWLRHQALIHHQYDFTLVHAGIAPQWSIAEALSYAREVETELRSNTFAAFLQHMYGNEPNNWHTSLSGYDRLRVITNYCTRMRFCFADGTLDLKNKKGIHDANPGTLPWFLLNNRQARHDKIIFGHWAALLGNTLNTANVFALDTGYIWGESLTMLRIDDMQRFSCHNARQL
jgi:bis(5'-nucleosyl)-tetraphosphatase (symmetrical)